MKVFVYSELLTGFVENRVEINVSFYRFVVIDATETDPFCQQMPMGLLPDTEKCRLCMRRDCRERFPRHRLQRKPLVSDPGMHLGTCVTHVPWCMSGSLTRGGGEIIPDIPGTCATHNSAYLVGGPCCFVIIHMHYICSCNFIFQQIYI